MKATDKAWLAGIIEGEGSIHTPALHNDPRRLYPRLVVSMNDEDVMRRVAALIGVKLYPPYGTRKSWQIQVAKRATLEPFLRELRPLMGERRRAQIDAALERWKSLSEI